MRILLLIFIFIPSFSFASVLHFENCFTKNENPNDFEFGGTDFYVFQNEKILLAEDPFFSFMIYQLDESKISNQLIGTEYLFDSEFDKVQVNSFERTFKTKITFNKSKKIVNKLVTLKVNPEEITDMFNYKEIAQNIDINGVVFNQDFYCEKVSNKKINNEYPQINTVYHSIWNLSGPSYDDKDEINNYYLRFFDELYCQHLKINNFNQKIPRISFPPSTNDQNCRYYFRFFDAKLGMFIDFGDAFFVTDDLNSTFMKGDFYFREDNEDRFVKEITIRKNIELSENEIYPEDRLIAFNFHKSDSNLGIEIKEKPKIPNKDNDKDVVKPISDEEKFILPEIMPISSGSGFYISNDGYVITNYHVVEGCDLNFINFQGKNYETNIIGQDPINDLALLKANLNPSDFYAIENKDASLLDDIIIAGYPLGKNVSSSIKTSKGSITSIFGYGDNSSNFQTDAALNQGNSGGPIINKKGNVIGVAVATFAKDEGVESFNFGIKSSVLKTFINTFDIKTKEPSKEEKRNSLLGKLINDATVYLECWMTKEKIERILKKENTKKALFQIN